MAALAAGASYFIVPTAAACAVIVLALWGTADMFENVVKPWIDAGDDDNPNVGW